MAYSALEDIQGEFKNVVFTDTSFVTSSSVEAFIDESDALINSYLRYRYITPITANSESLNLLRLFSRTLTADRVKKILEVKQNTNVSANQDVRGAYSTRDVIKALLDLKLGVLILDGATLINATGNFGSYNAEHNSKPVMQKDIRQW